MVTEVRSPISGIIQMVLVERGTKVAADDELLVIEAMKMQNLVYAPVGGTVKDVQVKPGDKVDDEALLMIIE